ncbi:hypothetical protein PAPYR_4019 [Paratrimastix pyriformis]|uniref:Uncharacterized protein n=1 Tax=Paratrimastix pyriformis TaxID=342808 RepID=A0ABQ8UQG3_9EUKA|nr:hypothetical protein PAPYR_4019 [Paratrimastix pyriformis]
MKRFLGGAWLIEECGAWMPCGIMRAPPLAAHSSSEYSGRILACHARDPGSIPGPSVFIVSLAAFRGCCSGLTLLVEYHVAIVVTRVQFPADASTFFLWHFSPRNGAVNWKCTVLRPIVTHGILTASSTVVMDLSHPGLLTPTPHSLPPRLCAQYEFSVDMAGKAANLGQIDPTLLKRPSMAAPDSPDPKHLSFSSGLHGDKVLPSLLHIPSTHFISTFSFIGRFPFPLLRKVHPSTSRRLILYQLLLSSNGVLPRFRTSTDKVLSTMLYILCNGPLVLSDSLLNISVYTAGASNSNLVLMQTAPIWTAVAGALLCLCGTWISCRALRAVSQERKTVLAAFLALSKDAVRVEFRRLQRKEQLDDAASPSAPVIRSSSGLLRPTTDHHRTTRTVPPGGPGSLSSSASANWDAASTSSGRSSAASPSAKSVTSPSLTAKRCDFPPTVPEDPSLPPTPQPPSRPVTPSDDGGDAGSPTMMPIVWPPGSAKNPPEVFTELEEISDPSSADRTAGDPGSALLVPSGSLVDLLRTEGRIQGVGACSVASIVFHPLGGSPALHPHLGDPAKIRYLMPPALDGHDHRELRVGGGDLTKAAPRCHVAAGLGGDDHHHRDERTGKSHVVPDMDVGAEENGPTRPPNVTMTTIPGPREGQSGASSPSVGQPSDDDDTEQDRLRQAMRRDEHEETRSVEADPRKTDHAADETRVGRRMKHLEAMHVITPGVLVRVVVAAVGVSLLIFGSGFVGLGHAFKVATFQTQIAASGIQSTQIGLSANLVYQLVFNQSIAVAPAPSLLPEEAAALQDIFAGLDSRYGLLHRTRSSLRLAVKQIATEMFELHKVLTSGGASSRFGSLVLPAGLHSLTEMDITWYTTGSCWAWDLENNCAPGRIANWGPNGTLAGWYMDYIQALDRMVRYEDSADLTGLQDTAFIDTSYYDDLSEGLERITMLYGVAFDAALATQSSLEMVFFGISIGAVVLSYFFLFRVNLIGREVVKTALMRAFLPVASQGLAKGTGKGLPPMNVKELDDLRSAFLDRAVAARQAVAHSVSQAVRPASKLLRVPAMHEAYEAMVAALRHVFGAEERLMSRHGLPPASQKAHAREHAHFLEKVFECPLAALREDRPGALDLVVAQLADPTLALEHGPVMDIPLGRFLNRRGIY